MSVEQEPLDVPEEAADTVEETAVEDATVEVTTVEDTTVEDSPEQDYDDVRTDSLVMFGAAIGGAILGMMLTLLLLAVLNGGTLNFARSAQQVEELTVTLERVNENVGAVSNNVDVVAARTVALEEELNAVEGTLSSELDAQSQEIDEINDSIATLDTTRQQFDVFVGALGTALDDVNAIGEGETVDAEADTASGDETASEDEASTDDETPSEASTETDELPLPSVESSTDLGPNDVRVVLYADANTDGKVDEGETSLVGITVSLTDENGDVVASGVTGDEGALFEGLETGDYELSVDDALGYELLSQGTAALVLGEGGVDGIVIFVPVATTAE